MHISHCFNFEVFCNQLLVADKRASKWPNAGIRTAIQYTSVSSVDSVISLVEVLKFHVCNF